MTPDPRYTLDEHDGTYTDLVGRRDSVDAILILVGHWERHAKTNNGGAPTGLGDVPDCAPFVDNLLCH